MSQNRLQQQTSTTTAISALSAPQQEQQQKQQQQQQQNNNILQQQQQSSENSKNSNTTYRPRSPDLSAYILPPHQQAAAYQQNQRNQPSLLFHPSYQDKLSLNYNHNDSNDFSGTSSASSWQRQGSITALSGLPSGTASYSPATHRGSYDASPYFSPQGSLSIAQGQSQGGYFVGGSVGGSDSVGGLQQQGQGQQLQRRETFGYGSATPGAGDYPNSNSSRLTYSPTATSSEERFGAGRVFPQRYQQSFVQNSVSGFSAIGQDQGSSGQAPVKEHLPSSFSPHQHPLPHPHQQPQYNNMPPSRRKRGQNDENDDSGGDFDYAPEASAIGRGAGGKSSRKRKSDHVHAWRAPGDPGPSLGIDVKTKFPVARIKRIMQADEDVGKVAQATPTAVSKALELFMITLVSKAVAEAKDRSSKRVTAAHLKQAVIKDPTFDFLQEIIEKVTDPTEKKGGRAGSEDLDDGAGAGAGGGATRKKRGPRAKKKADDDDDGE